jgi:lysyl-tRNA synthetase class 2
MFENQYIQQRIEKANELREMGINPYDNQSERDSTITGFKSTFSELTEPGTRIEDQFLTISGRIKFLRLMGKAAFAKIEDESGDIQVYYSKNALGDEWFSSIKRLVEVGDIIEVKGFPFVTKTGELTVNVQSFKILTKAISPLPEKFHGLTDIELRYRQRYLDLIMNREVMDTFKIRSKVVSTIRRFFEDKDFLEVETPMLHPIAGGANARPFITHHNALSVDRYMRIAPELYLKRLVVGGFEAVFEINRNFRNEGMDHTHNPEFTMIEFYWAYKTYKDLINITQEMFNQLFETLNLPKQLPYGEHIIDFEKEFTQMSYDESIIKIGGVNPEILLDDEKMRARLTSMDDEFVSKLNHGQLKAELFDLLVEDKLINPTFITDYPVEISPLARRKDDNAKLTDRFELFIAGKEIANGFSELNDPVDQYERFSGQMDAKDLGDDEAHEMDEDYVNALSYGMAPTAGQGLGIDRLVMILTNQHSIRDVLLFPAMRVEQKNNEENTEEGE